MLARALIWRFCRVVEGSCGLLAWFQTLQLLILDQYVALIPMTLRRNLWYHASILLRLGSVRVRASNP